MNFMRLLKEALAALASDYPYQLNYLSDELGGPYNVDELALQFYDVAVMADVMEEENLITHEQAEIIKVIDKRLECMSGNENAELWTPGGLRDSPHWQVIRELARTCLNMLSTQNDCCNVVNWRFAVENSKTTHRIDNIVSTLLQRIPSFARWREIDDYELPYVVFDEFGTFIQEMMDREVVSDDELNVSFELLNEMAETLDSEVANVLQTTVFEALLEQKYNEKARQMLKGKALVLFDELDSLWRSIGQ